MFGVDSLRPITTFLVCLLFTPALAIQPKKLDQEPLFPSRLGLQTKWDAFQKQPLTQASVAAMLKEDSDTSQVVRWGTGRYTSVWSAVHRHVAEDKKLAAQLRDAQDRGVQTLIDQASGELDKLTPTSRRSPWSPALHRALLEAGMRELRRGNPGFAARAFDDVLSFSADRKSVV